MTHIRHFIETFLNEHVQVSSTSKTGLTSLLLILALLLLSSVIVFLFLRIVVPIFKWATKKTTNPIDDILLNPKVLTAFGWCIPFFIFDAHISACLPPSTPRVMVSTIHTAINIYGLIAILLFLAEIIDIAHLFLAESKRYKDYHLGGIFQAFKVIIYCVGGIVLIALLIGQSPLNILAGLGASAAIIMLVFKDPILGFLASIQLTSNRMLKKEDWVIIDKLGINGKVEEVTLTTVKIRNFDNSISTVPPYTLVSDSFQNWSEMHQLGARRVRRNIYIDLNSISECTDEAGQPTTNLAQYRRYVERILERHPKVRTDPYRMVRLLEPTPQGLPLQVWFYLSETDFVLFEGMAAEIMEHLLTAMSTFGLRCFQMPSGKDLQFLHENPI